MRDSARTGGTWRASSSPVTQAITPACARARVASTRTDARVGMRAPHERDVEHTGAREVGDVAAVAREEARVLDPRHARADEGHWLNSFSRSTTYMSLIASNVATSPVWYQAPASAEAACSGFFRSPR